MKIALVVIGKTDAGYFVEAINEYKNRLVHYIPFEMEVIPDIKNVKNLQETQQKEKEGEVDIEDFTGWRLFSIIVEKGKDFYICTVFCLYRKEDAYSSEAAGLCCRWAVRI